ncbi:helix-turn-helix transcriptional regulator [Bdellovibrio sp. HCB185ZH]|uniref:helix-turn-helix transcriptional regulator n=1 Tax=Bdellovibrio sp. HCB185ZH TaxID=3394235 RepID=UPI0039A77809
MSTKNLKTKNATIKFLDNLIGEEPSIASELWAYRTSEEWSQDRMAKKLGISRVHYAQLENGKKFLSPERAASFAKRLGYSERLFVQISLQDQITRAKIPYRVTLSA